ncbi:MAG: di-heme oxidoredictase family protein [Gemmatimonadales bacterium]
MSRPSVLGALAALTLAGAACEKPLKPGDPVRGLARAERDRFERGRLVFDSVFTPATGLGPLFNSVSCGECHEDPSAGGFGDEVEVHAAAAFQPGAACDLLVERGGPVFQQVVTPALREALGVEREAVPAGATEARRSTPVVFGRGLLDAVPDSVILALADPDDRNRDGISGRPNRFFDGRLGRFGRKALVPTLREFNDGAFPIEQGVTNPAVPAEGTIGGAPIPPGVDPAPDPEIDQNAIDLTDAFVRVLAPPTPLRGGREVRTGRAVFDRVGCAACHVPTLRTGDSPVRALRNQQVAAYTDLLLHDMGAELADICFSLATPSEFRTEPLIGLRLLTQFLHDGRAKTLEEAIALHGGEAAGARDRLQALTPAEQAAVIAFLKTL